MIGVIFQNSDVTILNFNSQFTQRNIVYIRKMKDKELIAFYNVENLFDTLDDPHTYDEEFTPKGDRHWTEKRYENKIFKISHALKELGEDNAKMPFMVGLAEVENKTVLKDLQNQLPLYEYIHFDSRDERGIDVALLYQPKEFFITHAEPIYINLEHLSDPVDYTRDILYVNGTFKNKTLHVFVMHLPSKRNQDINREKRIFALQNLQSRIAQIYKEETQPAIIIMGDMNENPDKDILQEYIGYTPNPAKISGKFFYNPFYEQYQEEHYTLYHKNQGMLFDQIILSPYFFSPKSELFFSDSLVYDRLLLKEWQPQFQDKPFRTYVGRKYLGGYSDHFPVYVCFNDRKDPMAKYLDSTYLSIPKDTGLSEEETYQKVDELTQYAIDQELICAMIRPHFVHAMKTKCLNQNSPVHIGTVIDFPLGNSSAAYKMKEAQKLIHAGADELDFVMNYEAFKQRKTDKIKEEFLSCTALALKEDKIVKWIIETAALENGQIQKICKLYSDWSLKYFRNHIERIFVKSSTGYYQNSPKGYVGATLNDINIMVEAAYPLQIKASGGIRTRKQAQEFIKAGAQRIGTSSALAIMKGKSGKNENYQY